MDQVVQTIDAMVIEHHFNEVYGPFRLPIDRVFAMKGFGAVVTGTSISGRTRLGDDLRLYPSARTAKGRGIQVHSEAVEVVEAGHRTAINLQGTEKEEIERGMVLATVDSLAPSYMLDCSLTYLSSASKPLKHRARVRVHLGTAEIIGRVSLLDREELQPGDEAPVQLLLESEVAVWSADRYVIRSYSPVATIGGGLVVGNVSPRKRKRLTEKDQSYNRQVFDILMHGSSEEKCLLYLKESGMAGLSAKDLAIRLGVFGKHLDKILNIPLSTKQMVVVDSVSKRYVDQTIAEEVVEGIVSFLKSYHRANPLKNGLSKEEVRSGFKQFVDPKVFNYCLNDLLRKNTVVQEESIIRMADHEVALKADEQQLQRELAEWYRDKGLTAPTIKETFTRFSAYPAGLVKEVLGLLLKEGELVKISETLYFSAGSLNKLQAEMVAFIKEEGEIDAPRFKTLSGLTRKFSIPILEYFDRIKLTIRVGDCRKLRGQDN